MPRSVQLLILLSCSIVLAVVLRWPQMRTSLWLDELHTAWCIDGPMHDIAARAAIGNHPPTYFYALAGTTTLSGQNELGLRLPSFVAGLLLIGFCSWLVFRWSKSLYASALTGLLMSIDTTLIFYATEARTYAIVMLLCWLHAAIVTRLIRHPSTWIRAAFVIGAVCLFYLHYTAALFCAAEFAFLAYSCIQSRPSAAYRLRTMAFDLCVIGACWLATFPHLDAMASRRSDWASFVPAPSVPGAIRMFHLDVYALWPALGLAVARLWQWRKGKTEWRPVEWYGVRITAMLALIPPLIACLASIAWETPLFYRRYLLASYVATIILSVLVCSALPHRALRLVVGILVLIAALHQSGSLRYLGDREIEAMRDQDWRGAVAFVNANARADDIAFVRSGFIEADTLDESHVPLLEEYCLSPVNSLYELQIVTRPLTSSQPYLLAEDLPQLSRQKRSASAWFIINGSPDKQESFSAELATQLSAAGVAMRMESVSHFGNVSVYRVAVVDSAMSSSIRSRRSSSTVQGP